MLKTAILVQSSICIEYAYLSDYALEVISREETRGELRAFIESMLESVS